LPELRPAAASGSATGDEPLPPARNPNPLPRGTNESKADRYIVKNAAGQTLSPTAGGLASSEVSVLSASFATLADGTRQRTLMLSGETRGADGKTMPVTISYQGSAADLDKLLDRLAACAGGIRIVRRPGRGVCRVEGFACGAEAVVCHLPTSSARSIRKTCIGASKPRRYLPRSLFRWLSA